MKLLCSIFILTVSAILLLTGALPVEAMLLPNGGGGGGGTACSSICIKDCVANITPSIDTCMGICTCGYGGSLVDYDDSTTCYEKLGGWDFEAGLGIQNLIPGADPSAGPADFIRWLYLLGLAMAGSVALLMLVVGGIQYMAGAAGGSSGGQGKGKERIFNALLGLILLLASYLILNVINPELVNLRGTPPPPADKQICLPGVGCINYDYGERKCS